MENSSSELPPYVKLLGMIETFVKNTYTTNQRFSSTYTRLSRECAFNKFTLSTNEGNQYFFNGYLNVHVARAEILLQVAVYLKLVRSEDYDRFLDRIMKTYESS